MGLFHDLKLVRLNLASFISLPQLCGFWLLLPFPYLFTLIHLCSRRSQYTFFHSGDCLFFSCLIFFFVLGLFYCLSSVLFSFHFKYSFSSSRNFSFLAFFRFSKHTQSLGLYCAYTNDNVLFHMHANGNFIHFK